MRDDSIKAGAAIFLRAHRPGKEKPVHKGQQLPKPERFLRKRAGPLQTQKHNSPRIPARTQEWLRDSMYSRNPDLQSVLADDSVPPSHLKETAVLEGAVGIQVLIDTQFPNLS